MAAEFAVYSKVSGPDTSPPFVGHIYAEGQRLGALFMDETPALLMERMTAFWAAEVIKMHGSLEAREARIKARQTARDARKAKQGGAQ